jgi:hypothetical protein
MKSMAKWLKEAWRRNKMKKNEISVMAKWQWQRNEEMAA